MFLFNANPDEGLNTGGAGDPAHSRSDPICPCQILFQINTRSYKDISFINPFISPPLYLVTTKLPRSNKILQ